MGNINGVILNDNHQDHPANCSTADSRQDRRNTIDEDDDDDGWEEREASRTHSVKFTDELEADSKEVRHKCVKNIYKRMQTWFCCLCIRRFDAYTILATVADILD